MKHLWPVLILLLISCGKDNKTGKMGIPEGLSPNPLSVSSTNLHEFLRGHWVEKNGCHLFERSRRSGFKEQFEVRFYPATHLSQGMYHGEFSAGRVRYDERCHPNNQRSEEPSRDYFVVKEAGIFTSPYQNGVYEQDKLVIIDRNLIEFRGKRLERRKD